MTYEERIKKYAKAILNNEITYNDIPKVYKKNVEKFINEYQGGNET